MKIRVLLFLLALGGLVTWMWQDSSFFTKSVEPKIPNWISRQIASATMNSSTQENFEKRLQFEASRIAQIDSEPQKTEDDLRRWAQKLSSEELETLYKRSLDHETPQDERFLDVMLLGWSNNIAAQELLENIALDPIDDFLSPGRLGDFERILRMKAVEGLSDLPLNSSELTGSLQKIISKSPEAHIIDRAQRSLWASQGHASSPSEQDNEAFGKMLEQN